MRRYLKVKENALILEMRNIILVETVASLEMLHFGQKIKAQSLTK
jgi:hypothetical protein